MRCIHYNISSTVFPGSNSLVFTQDYLVPPPLAVRASAHDQIVKWKGKVLIISLEKLALDIRVPT